MRCKPICSFALTLIALIALPLSAAAGSTWDGNTDTWTDNDDAPWVNSAPTVADSSSGFGDDVNLTQSTSGDITITYEAGDNATGDHTQQGTRFGPMDIANSGSGTTTLHVDNSDDLLPTGGTIDVQSGGLLDVDAGTVSPNKRFIVEGGDVIQNGGLIQTQMWNLGISEGSYTINGGKSSFEEVGLSGSQGPASITVNTGGTLEERDAMILGGGSSAVTFTVDGGAVSVSRNVSVRQNATVELKSGKFGDPNANQINKLRLRDGTVNQTGGEMNAQYNQVIATTQGQSATYNLSGGSSRAGQQFLVGTTGGSAGGAGTFNHTGGTLSIGDSAQIGHDGATQTSRYILKGATMGTNGAFPLDVRQSGVLRGHGTVDTRSWKKLTVTGRIVADGYGAEHTLDVSEFSGDSDGGVDSPTDNPTDGNNGYFATGKAKLLLPAVLGVQSSNGSTYNFGEPQSDSTIDLINSARFTFNGLDDSGRSLSGALLDPARSDVDTGGLDLISVHDFDLSGSGGFTDFDLTLRYDQTALEAGEESILRLMHFDGSEWVDITSSRDTANNLITANGVDSFSQFGITTTIPEPGSLALLAPAGLLALRRRNR